MCFPTSSLTTNSLTAREFLFCLRAILPAKARKCSFVDSKDPSGNTCSNIFGSCWASTVALKSSDINEKRPSPKSLSTLYFGINICRPGRKFQFQNSIVLSINCQPGKIHRWYGWFLFGSFGFVSFAALGLQFVCLTLFYTNFDR